MGAFWYMGFNGFSFYEDGSMLIIGFSMWTGMSPVHLYSDPASP
jgi:hypothetical protein